MKTKPVVQSEAKRMLIFGVILEAEIALMKALGFSSYNPDIQHMLALVQKFQDKHFLTNHLPILDQAGYEVEGEVAVELVEKYEEF